MYIHARQLPLVCPEPGVIGVNPVATLYFPFNPALLIILPGAATGRGFRGLGQSVSPPAQQAMGAPLGGACC